MKVDCDICKNKGHDCLSNLDGSCDNFKLDCNLCKHRYAFCRCAKGQYCDDFKMADGHYEGEDYIRDHLGMDISKGVIK